MGIRGHVDALRGKYVTAIVTDFNHRAYFVPIKRMIGDYFLAAIGPNLYAFSVRGAPIYTAGEMGSRQARFILYDVSHYKAIDGAAIKDLDLVLTKNGLGRVDRMLLSLLRMLGREEARQEQEMRKKAAARAAAGEGRKGEAGVAEVEFTPHDLASLAKFVDENQALFPKEAEQLRTYLAELDIDEIATPVRKVADFLHENLIATDPSFLGELYSRMARTDAEDRIMTNAPKTAAMPWMKWGVVMAMVVGVIAIAGIGVNEGWFSSIGSLFPELDGAALGSALNPTALSGGGYSGPDCSDAGVMARYATPLDLKIAVQSGAETCALSEATTKMLEGVEMPKVVEAVQAGESTATTTADAVAEAGKAVATGIGGGGGGN